MPVTVTHVASRDDGGYINIGRQTGLAPSHFTAAGVTYCFWCQTVDANNIIPIGPNFFAYPAMGGSQYSLLMLNSNWTTDYQGQANSVNLFPSGNNAVSWAKWKATGQNFNDSKYHHHGFVFAGLSGGQPTRLDYYLDGNLIVSGQANWTDYSDGTPTTRGDYGADVYLGCTQKGVGNTLTDFASFRLADYRTYAANLTTPEMKEIALLCGRDNVIRGLISRYDLQFNVYNRGSYGVAAILANDNGTTPTYNTDPVLQGTRRKVM